MMINMPKIVFEVVFCMLFTVKKKVRSTIARQFVFCTRVCSERAICKLAFILGTIYNQAHRKIWNRNKQK